MTLYEFKMLDRIQQYEVTFKHGTFIGYHLEIEKRFALYLIDKFFVEIEYDIECNKIINIQSFVEEKN